MIDFISMETCSDILKQLLLFLRNFSYRKRVYELLIEQQKNKTRHFSPIFSRFLIKLEL